MNEFFSMESAAIFIWVSYGLTMTVLIGLLALSFWQRHAARARWGTLNPRQGEKG